MNISVLTPDKTIFEGAIKSLMVPGVAGRFEIRRQHAALVSALKEGKVVIVEEDGGRKSFGIEKGFVEVLNDNISLLVQGVTEES